MRLTHGRITLELCELAPERGSHNDPALLMLHALFGSSTDWGEAAAIWPGAVYALDFCGHGRSEHLVGGGYFPELLVADADTALALIGRAALAGAGLGAYVALLLAGARARQVPAALLLPGAGLAGGGPLPRFDRPRSSFDAPAPGEPSGGGHDPLVRVLDQDVRPIEYVEPFARAARRLLLAEDGQPRPPWWAAARHSPSAAPVPVDLGVALTRLADEATAG